MESDRVQKLMDLLREQDIQLTVEQVEPLLKSGRLLSNEPAGESDKFK